MNRLILFIVIVCLAVFAVLFVSNQSTQNTTAIPNLPFSIITPTVNNVSIPVTQSLSPTISQESEPISTQKATIQTSKGNIVISFYTSDAPHTVKNFVQKTESGFYNNLVFHRVEDWVVQGGDPKGNGMGGGDMSTELNNKPFVVGSLGVARKNDIKISNDAQFFITKKESPHLNNQYTNFGIVTEGMDVVNKLQIGDKILGITIVE